MAPPRRPRRRHLLVGVERRPKVGSGWNPKRCCNASLQAECNFARTTPFLGGKTHPVSRFTLGSGVEIWTAWQQIRLVLQQLAGEWQFAGWGDRRRPSLAS